MASSKAKQAERQEFIEKLRELLKPGMTLHTVLKHRSSSGMSRAIDVYLLKDQDRDWLSYWVAKAIDHTFSERYEAIQISGCGMDMGFEIVYTLGRVLFPDGFGVEGELPDGTKVRPLSRENAEQCIKNGAKFRGRNGDSSGWDNDGGYALKQEWL